MMLFQTALLAQYPSPTDIPPPSDFPSPVPSAIPNRIVSPTESSPPSAISGNVNISLAPNVEAAVNQAVGNVITALGAGSLTSPTGNSIPGGTQEILLNVLTAEPVPISLTLPTAPPALSSLTIPAAPPALSSSPIPAAPPALSSSPIPAAPPAPSVLTATASQSSSINREEISGLISTNTEQTSESTSRGEQDNSPSGVNSDSWLSITGALAGAPENLARDLASSLLGLVKCSSVAPASCKIKPAKLLAAVYAYNAVINSSSEEFLRNPPTALLAIRAILSELVDAAIAADAQQKN